jgi:hypothetical protein
VLCGREAREERLISDLLFGWPHRYAQRRDRDIAGRHLRSGTEVGEEFGRAQRSSPANDGLRIDQALDPDRIVASRSLLNIRSVR